MSNLYYISKEEITNKEILFGWIYPHEECNYYVADDFSSEFYIMLSRAGFISVYEEQDDRCFLLPEMQFEYALLEFQDLHISKKVAKLLKKPNYSFRINYNIKGVIAAIQKHHEQCWIKGEYEKTLHDLLDMKSNKFELMSFEIWQDNSLIAAELGYKIAKTYTSLSGFSKKEKPYNNYGKLQLTLTAQYLQQNNYAFWNLGHPYMEYKTDLGAKILKRNDFLKKWLGEVGHV